MSELSIEEESMSLTAAIFLVRYRPVLFNDRVQVLKSSIASDINNLIYRRYGHLDDFHIDLKTLHYAFEHYSAYFRQSALGMELSTTKQRGCTIEGISINYPASTRGWEITFTDCNYRNREQAWFDKEKAVTINEKSLSELITEARIDIILVCKNVMKS